MTYAYCRKPVFESDNQSITAVYDWAERYGLHIDELYLETEEESKSTDLQEIDMRKFQVQLCSKLQILRNSIKNAEKAFGNVTMELLFDDETIKSFDIKDKLKVLLDQNRFFF